MIKSSFCWDNWELYFEKIDEKFLYFTSFPIWQWSDKIEDFLSIFFTKIHKTPYKQELENCNKNSDGLYFYSSVKIKENTFLKDHLIYLEKGVKIEAGVSIKPSCVILADSCLRQSAYLRENALIGKFCTIGHCSEVKNSLVLGHSELGHLNYVGDSIIGSYCNLGAATILCNLPFRTQKQKMMQIFPKFSINVQQQKISAQKKGVVLGDACETGCNSTIGPMSFLGKNSVVYPNIYISKGVFPSASKFKKSFL